MPGWSDVRRAADQLTARLPARIAPLARLAFNYAWSWTRNGDELFASVDAHRWEACQRNPVRLLQEAHPSALERAATDRRLLRQAHVIEERLLSAPRLAPVGDITSERPVAFLCAEYGVHTSLPIYAGG